MRTSSNKPHQTSVQFFTSISKNSTTFRAWFAILSFFEYPPSYITDIFISLLEYLQLLSQAFLTYSSFDPTSQTFTQLIYTLDGISKLLNPGYFISTDQLDKTVAIAIFIVLLTYSILKYGLLGYIILIAIKRKFCSKPLLWIWRWVFRLQGRCVFYFLTSIWGRILMACYNDQVGLEKSLNMTLMGVSGVVMLLEFIFSFIVVTQFSYPIPSKRFLIAKNQHTETITLVQKALVQVLNMIFSQNSSLQGLIRCAVGSFFCLIRNVYYFTDFPHYRLEAVLYYSGLLMAVTCINVSFLLHIIYQKIYGDQLSLDFSLILCVILTVLSTKLCRGYARHVWLGFVLTPWNNSKGLVIHRIITAKKTLKYKGDLKRTSSEHSFAFLVTTATKVRVKAGYAAARKIHISEVKEGLETAEDLDKALVLYLKSVTAKFPTDGLIKLYKGYYFGHKLKLYGNAVKILQELQQSSSTNIATSASILLYTIQESMIADYKNKNNKLDLYSYMMNVKVVSELKEGMLNQAKCQIELYENFVQTHQDPNIIFELGQRAEQYRFTVERKIQRLQDNIPGYYIEPLMICAHYYFVLNHAPHRYQQYTETHRQKHRKFRNFLEKENLCQENLYQKDTHLLVVSSGKNELGIIKYMSKNAYEVFGKDKVNNHFCSLLQNEFKDVGYTVTNAVLDTVDKTHMNQLDRAVAYHCKGKFFMQSEQYFNVCPLLYQDLYALVFIRIPSNSEQFMIVKENGDIIGYTKKLGQKLGLYDYQEKLAKDAKINIRLLSEKLARVNQAFNMILSPEKHSGIDCQDLQKNEANNLHDIFSNLGEDLDLNSLGGTNGHRFYRYNCKFESKHYGGATIRVVVLQKSQNVEYNIKRANEDVSMVPTKVDDTSPLQIPKENNSEESVESEHIIKMLSDKEEYFTSRYFPSYRNNSSYPDQGGLETQKDEKRNLNIFTTEQDYMSSRKLLSARTFTTRLGTNGIESPKEEGVISPISVREKNEPENRFQNPKQNEYQPSQTTKQKNINQLAKDYENALCSKYYPIYFRLYILLFYGVFISIFATSIHFTDTFKNNLQIFQARKNTLRLVVERTDYFTNLYGMARRLYIYAKGQQNESDYAVIYRSSVLIGRMQATLDQLSQANKDMMVGLETLDSPNQQLLLQKNIKILDTQKQTIITTDSFQATDALVEIGLRGVTLANNSLQAALPDLNLLLINAPNDLLYVSQKIASLVATSVYSGFSQTNNLVSGNRTNLVTSLTLLTFVFLIFCLVVLKQYNEVKRNMQALSRLNISEVVRVMERVSTFQTMLQDEADFEEIQSLDAYSPSKMQTEKFKNMRNEKDTKTKDSDFKKKYWLYPVKFLVLLLIVITLVLVKFFVINNSAIDLSYIINQLYFSDRIKPRARLSAALTQDLLSDKTQTIRNLALLSQYNVEVYFLQNSTHNMTDYLKRRDGTYDPIIQDILFTDGCQYMSSTAFASMCYNMSQGSQNTGLIKFMTNYQSVLTDFLNKYKLSNKTTASLAALGLQTYNSIVPPTLVIVDLLSTISARLDVGFYNNITSTSSDGILNSDIAMLVVIGLLLHTLVISQVQGTENRFRNLLKAFPAKLVLSNFMLKSYLMRTWREMPHSSRLINSD